MSVLLDVNLLLACGWRTHAHHAAAVTWLDGQEAFHTCPLVELGFLRVRMGPAFRAPFADVKGRTIAQRMADDLDTANLLPLSSHAEVTDAYLVELARSKGLRLATLDEALCATAWAAEIAFNPLPVSKPPA